MRKLVVTIPTYNEKDNIRSLIDSIFAVLESSAYRTSLECHVMVVDDNSPDGTGAQVLLAAKTHPNTQLVTRYKRRGRGNAGVEGFMKALVMGADLVLEMDADFSHDPRHIPAMLDAVLQENGPKAALVVGSRLVPGGSDNDRSFVRQNITKISIWLSRTLLSLPVRDVNSGYRLYTRAALEGIDVENFLSTGPSIVCEALYKTSKKGFKIAEVPIQFIDRKLGSTKLNWITLLEVFVMVLKLRDLNKRGQLFPKPLESVGSSSSPYLGSTL